MSDIVTIAAIVAPHAITGDVGGGGLAWGRPGPRAIFNVSAPRGDADNTHVGADGKAYTTYPVGGHRWACFVPLGRDAAAGSRATGLTYADGSSHVEDVVQTARAVEIVAPTKAALVAALRALVAADLLDVAGIAGIEVAS